LFEGIKDDNAKFEVDVEILRNRKVQVRDKKQLVTNCKYHGELTCHEDCAVLDKKDCFVMDDGICNICNCPHDMHTNSDFYWETYKEITKTTKDMMKAEYENATGEVFDCRKAIDCAVEEIMQLRLESLKCTQ